MKKVRQREIKFRLYFYEGKRLTYSTHTFKVTDKRLHIMLARFEENTIVGFAEWTGLKDKNGKDIYEGDVVRDDEATYKIYWASDACAFDAERLEDGSAMIGFGCYGRDLIADIIQSSKVIGNIYEHKHLLSQGEIKTKLI